MIRRTEITAATLAAAFVLLAGPALAQNMEGDKAAAAKASGDKGAAAKASGEKPGAAAKGEKNPHPDSFEKSTTAKADLGKALAGGFAYCDAM